MVLNADKWHCTCLRLCLFFCFVLSCPYYPGTSLVPDPRLSLNFFLIKVVLGILLVLALVFLCCLSARNRCVPNILSLFFFARVSRPSHLDMGPRASAPAYPLALADGAQSPGPEGRDKCPTSATSSDQRVRVVLAYWTCRARLTIPTCQRALLQRGRFLGPFPRAWKHGDKCNEKGARQLRAPIEQRFQGHRRNQGWTRDY